MNLVSEANKIGLSFPIDLGVSSPYELIISTPESHPPGRLRLEFRITTPDTQAKPTMEETPRDQPEVLEGRKQKKGKNLLDEESLERRGEVRRGRG